MRTYVLKLFPNKQQGFALHDSCFRNPWHKNVSVSNIKNNSKINWFGGLEAVNFQYLWLAVFILLFQIK